MATRIHRAILSILVKNFHRCFAMPEDAVFGGSSRVPFHRVLPWSQQQGRCVLHTGTCPSVRWTVSFVHWSARTLEKDLKSLVPQRHLEAVAIRKTRGSSSMASPRETEKRYRKKKGKDWISISGSQVLLIYTFIHPSFTYSYSCLVFAFTRFSSPLFRSCRVSTPRTLPYDSSNADSLILYSLKVSNLWIFHERWLEKHVRKKK